MHTWPRDRAGRCPHRHRQPKYRRRRSRPSNRADCRLASPAATLRLRPNHAAAWRTDRSNVSTLPGPRRSGRSGPSGRSQRPRLQAHHTIAHDHATIAGPTIGAVAETNWLHGIGNQSQTRGRLARYRTRSAVGFTWWPSRITAADRLSRSNTAPIQPGSRWRSASSAIEAMRRVAPKRAQRPRALAHTSHWSTPAAAIAPVSASGLSAAVRPAPRAPVRPCVCTPPATSCRRWNHNVGWTNRLGTLHAALAGRDPRPFEVDS